MLQINIRLSTNRSSRDIDKDTKSDSKQTLSEQPPLDSSPPAPLTPVSNFPTPWNVPQQNKHFISRSCLGSLQKSLNDSLVVVCHGSGGMGKTALALEFVYKNHKKYNQTAWFNAKNEDELLREYDKLGQHLDLPLQKENHMQVKGLQVKRYLQKSTSDKNWLLVYDNVETYNGSDGIEKWIPSPSENIHVLITSRLPEAPYKSMLPIGKFSRDDASIKCIQKILDKPPSEKNTQSIHKLAKKLNDIPLGLVLASAYINTAQIEVSNYLKLYKKEKKILKTCPKFARLLKDDYPKAVVYIHWSIVIEKMCNASHLALNWLKMCSYLANEIPDFLFKAFAEKELHNNPDEKSYEKAREILKSCSMLTMNEKNESGCMHSLLQEVIRMREEKSKTQDIILLNAAKLLHNCCPEGKQIEDCTKMRKLLPHFETLLPFLKKISHEIFKAREFLLSHLFHQAQICGALGNPHKQAELLEELLLIQDKHYPKDHVERAKALVSLGNAYGALGRSDKTRKFLEEALSILGTYFGEEDIEVAKILVNIGNAHAALEQPDKTKNLLERALPILETHYGNDHVEVAKTLVHLGNAYGPLGNFHKQKALLERALPILETYYSKEHVEVAKALAHLGNAYGALGNFHKQKALLEKALPILEAHYGKEHIEVMTVLIDLANAYDALKEFGKQKELLEKALPILEKGYDKKSAQFIKAQINLRNAYNALGDFYDQKELLEKAFPNLERFLGNQNVEVIKTLIILGNTYGALRDFIGQKEVQERAIFMIKNRILMNDNPYDDIHNRSDLARLMLMLANSYGALEDFAKQKECIENAFLILMELFPKGDPELIKTIIQLRQLYAYLGDFDNQQKFLHKALPILINYYGKDHVEVSNTALNLAKVYHALRKVYQQKKALDLVVLAVLETTYGPKHLQTITAKIMLADAYFMLGYNNFYRQKELLQESISALEDYYRSFPLHVEVLKWKIRLEEIKRKQQKAKPMRTLSRGGAIKFLNARHVYETYTEAF